MENTLHITKIQKYNVYLLQPALLVGNICNNAVEIFKNNKITTYYTDADITLKRMNL